MKQRITEQNEDKKHTHTRYETKYYDKWNGVDYREYDWNIKGNTWADFSCGITIASIAFYFHFLEPLVYTHGNGNR